MSTLPPEYLDTIWNVSLALSQPDKVHWLPHQAFLRIDSQDLTIPHTQLDWLMIHSTRNSSYFTLHQRRPCSLFLCEMSKEINSSTSMVDQWSKLIVIIPHLKIRDTSLILRVLINRSTLYSTELLHKYYQYTHDIQTFTPSKLYLNRIMKFPTILKHYSRLQPDIRLWWRSLPFAVASIPRQYTTK